MSGVWKLFYKRRYVAGRDADDDGGFGSAAADRESDLRAGTRHRHGQNRSSYHPGDPHVRHQCHRQHRTENDSLPSDHKTNEFGTGTGQVDGSASTRVGRSLLMRNDQLPDAVLEARARLLERLRSCSLTRNRHGNVQSGINSDEFPAGDDLRFSNYVYLEAGEAGTRRQQLNSVVPYIEFVLPAEQRLTFEDPALKNSSGINLEPPRSSLHQEIFRSTGVNDGFMRGSPECCICLERFVDGDGLICLDCAHRFHPTCLKPWLQTIRNCPYCRSSIAC